MIATSTQTKLQPLAILSLLGDSPTRNAATRTFRGRSVLTQTFERICATESQPDIAVLVWDDQREAVAASIDDSSAIHVVGPRRMTQQMNLANASLRWADGWRGGLMGVSAFDRGFDARSIQATMDQLQCNAALLIDPYSALITPESLDAMIAHMSDRGTLEYAFLPGTPGTGAMMLRASTLADLLKTSRLPGQMLNYNPDRPRHDPLAKEFAVHVSPRVARSLVRLTLDSDRQTSRLSLMQTQERSAETIIEQLQGDSRLDPMPREIVLELNTVRATRPVYSLLGYTPINRPSMTLAQAKALFEQLAHVDDLRLTFAGVGDPLLHDQFDEILQAARDVGIAAIHVETDLLAERREYLDLLAQGAVDVVSVHLPALHRDTYREMMGVDRIQDVMDQVKQLVVARSRNQIGLPIIVPTFTKCEHNLGEMEAWYDQWIRAIGAAVVRGPSDFGSEIPFIGVSDMLPPNRQPCRRLRLRITVLSDGTFVSCEEDVRGVQSVGRLDRDRIESAWSEGLDPLRRLPASGKVCVACRMWDRP